MSSTARGSIARSAVQRLKTLRHPDILRFLAQNEGADGTIQVATEYAIPLDEHIARNGPLKPQELQWGLVCVARALGFMHSSKLIHGSLCPSSVFVTPGGDWKVGGFLYTTQLANAQSLLQSANFVPQPYVSPELASGNINAILNSHASAIDSWAFGCLMHEVFGGAGRELTDTSKLPRQIVPAYQKLLSSKPSTRVPVGDFQQHPYFKKSQFVEMNLFMETAPLKGEFERETFFRKLVALIPNLPRGFCINKLLPLLSQTIETKEGAAVIAAGSSSSTVSAIKSLAGVPAGPTIPANRQPPGATVSGAASAATSSAAFDAIEAMRALLGEEDFQREVVSKYAIRLYGDPGVDRSVRVNMYNNISGYIGGMDEAGLNGPVFSAVCGSFGDAASPAVRDAAVKAVLVLVPKLSSRNLNTSLMTHFARLQVDPEPAIRTNTTVCLGKLASKLSESVQKKVLVPAFLRSLKDPFPPAKTAGLAALVDTGAFFSVDDLARKILPATVPLMIDPTESVRSHAFKVFDKFRNNLEENHRHQIERAKYAPKNTNGPTNMQNGTSGVTNGISKSTSWGLSSLGGLASALLTKEGGPSTGGASGKSGGVSSEDFNKQGPGVGFGSNSYVPAASSNTAASAIPNSGMGLGNGSSSFTSSTSGNPISGFENNVNATKAFENSNDLLLDDDDDDPAAWGAMDFNDEPQSDSTTKDVNTPQTEEDLFVSMMGPTASLKKPPSGMSAARARGTEIAKSQALPATQNMGIQLQAPTIRKKKAAKADDDWGALLGGTGSSSRRRQGGLGARRR